MTVGAHSLRLENDSGRISEPSGFIRKRTDDVHRKQKTREVQRVVMNPRPPSGRGTG